MSAKPEALRLARELEGVYPVNIQDQEAAAAELRRLYAETTNQQDWLVEMTKGEHEIRRLHAENADLSDQCLQSVLAISALNDEIGRITEQRDEMLAALQACHEAMSYMSEYDIPLTLPEQVKAAIDKAIG